MTENSYRAAKGFLILAMIIAVIIVVPSVVQWGNSLMPAKTITVSAEADTTVSPNLATVSFSEVTVGANPTTIETDNINEINSAISLVEKEGIASSDIATTDYNLSPNYNYNPKIGNSSITGYTITETETVKIRDFTKIPPILSDLTTLGVNQIGQVSFSVENPDSYLTNAREQAFAKAQLKAQQMAADNGVKLGRIINLTESSSNPGPLPVYNEMSASASFAAAATPTIQPGTQQLTDEVSITYTIQ